MHTPLLGVLPAQATIGGRRHEHWGTLKRFKELAKTPEELALKEELDKGYWGDANELLKNREGKFFFAVPKLTPKKEAIKLLDAIPASLPTYKPFDFSKVNIEEAMHTKAPTLVLVTCKRMFATAMLDSWRKPFEAEFPHLNCYELELVQQVGYWWFGGLFRMFAAKEIEPSRMNKVLYYNGIRKTKRMRWDLNIKNRYCAYAFLCDEDGLVRWRAVGLANTEELAMLNKMVNKLQQEKGVSSSNNLASRSGLEHQQKAD